MTRQLRRISLRGCALAYIVKLVRKSRGRQIANSCKRKYQRASQLKASHLAYEFTFAGGIAITIASSFRLPGDFIRIDLAITAAATVLLVVFALTYGHLTGVIGQGSRSPPCSRISNDRTEQRTDTRCDPHRERTPEGDPPCAHQDTGAANPGGDGAQQGQEGERRPRHPGNQTPLWRQRRHGQWQHRTDREAGGRR